MITSSENSSLDTNLAKSNFSIEMNGTMFSMLSKNVYNDIILAPMREWSTNAVDACLAADTEVRFEVMLPTAESPTFSVRDYGTGLTEEEVTTLFATFGASTKRDSNKFNGTFGIGRMSALAYTTQFSVETFLDGTHSTFLVTTQDSIPQMIKLGSTTTTEDNGLKLSLSVEPRDIEKFTRRARKLYRYFDHKPTLNVSLDLSLPKGIQGTDWFIDNSGTSYSSPVAVMGNVAYEIDTNHARIPYAHVVSVPLGALSITPGRETLNYDDVTVETLQKFEELIATETEQVLTTALNKVKKDSYKEISQFCRNIRSKVEYRMANKVAQNLTVPHRYFQLQHGLDFTFKSSLPNDMIIKTKLWNSERLTAEPLDLYRDSKFMIMDTRTQASAAMGQYAAQSKDTPSAIIGLFMEKFTKANLEKFVSGAKQFLSDIGVVDYALSSDYVSDKRGSSGNAVKTFKPYLVHMNRYNSFSVTKSHTAASEFTKAIYIPISGSTVEPTDKLIAYSKYLELLDDKLSQSTWVYGVPKAYMKQVEEMDTFTTLYDHVDSIVKNEPVMEVPDQESTSQRIYRAFKYLGDDERASVDWPIDAKEYVREFSKFENTHMNFISYTAANCEKVNAHFTIKTLTPQTSITGKQLEDRYPLLCNLLKSSHTSVQELNYYLKLQETHNAALCKER